MIEHKQNSIVKKEVETKSVHIVIQSQLVILNGDWKWDLHTDQVFCSDVMLHMPEDFLGTKGIIHPDDLAFVKEAFGNIPNRQFSLTFRIITTYGEVKVLEGCNLAIEETVSISEEEKLEKEYLKIKEDKEKEQFLLRKEVIDLSEKIYHTGTYIINSSTHEVFYSDNFYRIYGLAPQSLNAHVNTFINYIHPDDSTHVQEAFDTAYKFKLPLHLEYRIKKDDGIVKQLQHITYWIFNAKGEQVLSGLIKDITDQKEAEQQQMESDAVSILQKKMLNFTEQTSQTGTWQVNLITRRTLYSDNFYRICGLKPVLVSNTTNVFLNLIHPEDREDYINASKKMMLEHNVPDIDFRIIRLDGKTRHLRQRAKLITYNENELMIVGTVQDVTGQQIQENKIRELSDSIQINNLTNEIVENTIQVGSWVWDRETDEMLWSKSIYTIFGYKYNTVQFSKKLFISLLHPEDKNVFNKNLNNAIAGEPVEDFVFRIITKGEVKHLSASFHLINKEEKQIFIAIFKDNTEAQEKEFVQQRKTQIARLLNENIKDRILVTDINYNIQEWNKQCELFYNKKSEDVIGLNFFDVFPKLKTQKTINAFQRVLDGDTVIENDLKSELHSGYFDLYMSPMKDDKNNVIGIFHLLHDTSKEIELKQNLRMRLAFIENIVDVSVDRIIVTDRNMNYLLWNKKCEDYYGIKKEDIIGKNVLEIYPDIQNQISYVEFKRAIKGETIHIPVKNTGDGKYEEIYLIPVKDDKDEITAVLWVLHDISKDMALQKQLRKTNQVLDALNECYFELNNDYGFSYVNTMAEGFFAKSREDLLGKNILEAIPELKDSALMTAIIKAFEEGGRTVDEFISPLKDNWIYVSIAPTIDGVVVVFYDINEIKESQFFIEQVMEATPDFVSVFDLEKNKVIYINKAPYKQDINRYKETLTFNYNEILQRAHPEDVGL